jgi:predicted nucleic acid-binding Zn ribbon protein
MALQSLFRQLGVTRKVQHYTLITSWDSIVGERIARISKARKVDNGVLFVEVANGPWRTELAMRKREILEKIVRKIGKNIVKDIRFH